MTKKYLNDRYCVRCNRHEATPYLKKHWNKLVVKDNPIVCDLGCGNGRNSKFACSQGAKVISLDMVNDFGKKIILGKDKLPLKKADIILANYILMFLNNKERKFLLSEIKRIASKDCRIMVELYPALDSETKNEEEMLKLQKEIFDSLKWEKILYSKGRFIAKKGK
jgi:hypothetical protein